MSNKQHQKSPSPTFNLIQGDCLEVMDVILDGSVHMVLADPPYGTTSCKWDSIIPLDRMWECLKRVIKSDGVIVIMSNQPFTTALISSNMKMFKYCWVWKKNSAANFANARRMPLKTTEDICVFGGSVYYPIKTKGKMRKGGGDSRNFAVGIYKDKKIREKTPHYDYDKYYPVNLIDIPGSRRTGRGLHPTQKPIALMEYLIQTYTKENETVLDFSMGSGTTGVACRNLNRNFIGIELDEKYFKLAERRIKQARESSSRYLVPIDKITEADEYLVPIK